MKYFFAMVTTVVVLLGVGGVMPAQADQNDNRLDTLFGRLQQTESLDEASGIVEQIWVVWTEIDDQEAYGEMLEGVKAMAHQDFDAALATFDGVVNKFPKFAEAWNKRATVYYLMGRFEESLSDVDATLDLEPRHFGALSGKGLILMSVGDYPHAIKAFEHALEANPHMPSVRMRIQKLHEVLDKNAI